MLPFLSRPQDKVPRLSNARLDTMLGIVTFNISTLAATYTCNLQRY